MRITKNFQTEEFVISDSYPDIAAQIELSPEDITKMELLTHLFLQPTRDQFGAVKILSGIRSRELNELIGGSLNSDHLYRVYPATAAVDFTCSSVGEAYKFLKMRGPFAYGQLILYQSQHFIHVSLPTEKHVGEAWIKT